VERPPYQYSYGSKPPLATFTFADQETSILAVNKLKWGEKEIFFGRVAFDATNQRIFTASVNTEKSNPKKELYAYTLRAHLNSGSAAELAISFPYGIEHLEVNERGQLVAYNNHSCRIFAVESGILKEVADNSFARISRKGVKTANRIGRLLGGGDEEPEGVPYYLTADYSLTETLATEGFDPASLGSVANRYQPILGLKTFAGVKGGIGYFAVIDKETGEEAVHRYMIYDNVNFTHDTEKNLIYLIDGRWIHWYRFD